MKIPENNITISHDGKMLANRLIWLLIKNKRTIPMYAVDVGALTNT